MPHFLFPQAAILLEQVYYNDPMGKDNIKNECHLIQQFFHSYEIHPYVTI
jgi:hypothetical protein